MTFLIVRAHGRTNAERWVTGTRFSGAHLALVWSSDASLVVQGAKYTPAAPDEREARWPHGGRLRGHQAPARVSNRIHRKGVRNGAATAKGEWEKRGDRGRVG